jgi:hypothetical protein
MPIVHQASSSCSYISGNERVDGICLAGRFLVWQPVNCYINTLLVINVHCMNGKAKTTICMFYIIAIITYLQYIYIFSV